MRKRINRALVIFMAVILTVLSVPYAFAYTIDAGTCGENLIWVFDSDGVLTISGSGNMTNYKKVEPAAWSDYKESIVTVNIKNGVQSIGSFAFFECNNLTNISIPNTVTSIGDYAFQKCIKLETVTIPNSVMEFGWYIFKECESLKQVNWPTNAEEIPYGAFSKCTSLDSFIFSENVKEISPLAFAGCESLTEITIPSSVSSIDEMAFSYCTNLTSVIINDAAVEISNNVFLHCENLAEVILGSNVTFISFSAFNYTAFISNQMYDEDGVMYIGSVLFRISSNYNKESLTVKYGTTLIAEDAMVTQNAINIKSITVPDTVKYINDYGIGYYYTYGKISETPIPDVKIYYHKNTVTKEFWPEAIQVGCNWQDTVIKEATCMEQGEVRRVCSLCGDTRTEHTTNPNNHDYGNWTNQGDGTHIRFCKRNAAHSEVGAHNWTNWVAVQNVEKRSCTICGAEETRTIQNNVYNLGEETYSFQNYSDSDSRGGHCFGMSSTSSMYYLGLMNLSVIGGTTGQALYSFGATDRVKKPICHYQAIQGSYSQGATVAGGSYYLHGYNNVASDWTAVVNYVKNHNFDNKGSLQIGFRKSTQGGHAINFLRYEVVNGQERIYAYDNNFPTVETYFYQDASGNVWQKPYSTFSGSIDCIALRDVSTYYRLAGSFDASHVFYAAADEIVIENAEAYAMECGPEVGEYYMYELSSGSTQVQIIPQKDNATFTYLDQEYSFSTIDGDTYGVVTLSSMNEGGVFDNPTFTIYNAPNDTPDPEPSASVCPWCGGQHVGFFAGIIGWFHSILARIFGARY